MFNTNTAFAHLAGTMPAPPVDMAMPGVNATIVAANWTVAAVLAVFLVRESIKHKTALPLLIMIGALVASPQEAIWDILGAVWYPDKGAIMPVYTAFGVTVEAWLPAAWAWYVGGLAYFAYRRFEHGVTSVQIFLLYLLGWAANFLLEMPGLNLGVYSYYGNQPFRLFEFPLWMAMTNALMPIVLGAACYRLKPILTGPKILLVVPIVPMASGFAQSAAGWPTWLALNSGVGLMWTNVAALVSLGLSLTIVYLTGRLFGVPAIAKAASPMVLKTA